MSMRTVANAITGRFEQAHERPRSAPVGAEPTAQTLRSGGLVRGLGGDARQAEPFIYQQIAERANVLRRRGMSASSIARRRLGMSDKTVTKALRRFEKNTQSMPRS